MGGSNIISVTLQDHIFPVALVFYMYEMSIMLNADNSISGSLILSPICQATCS